MCSVCPSVCAWKLVDNLRLVPNILKSSVQKCSVNRGSRSLTMLFGTPQSFIMCLTNRRAASSALQSTGEAMNVAYLLYRLTTTMMLPHLSDLGMDVMKSMETHPIFLITTSVSCSHCCWPKLLYSNNFTIVHISTINNPRTSFAYHIGIN